MLVTKKVKRMNIEITDSRLKIALLTFLTVASASNAIVVISYLLWFAGVWPGK